MVEKAIATILLVEDDIAISTTFRDLLEEEGYRVVTAENGRIALESLAVECPDLIVLDTFMPVLDGPGTLRELRVHGIGSAIPVIMVSAGGCGSAANADAQALGVSAVLPKPYDVDRLLREIARALGGAAVPS